MTPQTNLPDESVRPQVHHQSLREGKQVIQRKRLRTTQGAELQTVRKYVQMRCGRFVSKAVKWGNVTQCLKNETFTEKIQLRLK